ncbi:restriction endonuclease subunit S [Streptococcus parasuis]|uniref:restriction endonuclease subunit S n=1 Tax=Streptococcus parasuis TaxID=1501662 RepID=UPI0023791740|nr:restriction endonuclease subunit S [Streptococcus parasuis]WDN60251.1 restriction endonuclease subunit S [Streptococcus parasuis]
MMSKKSPQLRFEGFTDDWEERKLGDITKRVIRKNKNLESTLPLTISAQEGLIDQNEFFNKTIASRDVSGYYLIKNGEFAYNKSYSNGYPWGAVKRLNRYNMGVLSTLYIVFKPTNIDSDFLEKYYDTTYWHKEISKHAAEGARNHGLLNIAATDFFKTKLVISKSLEEQQKIGSFLKKLDEIIALHQRKLDLLKEQKKGFLQKMFPKNGAKVPELRFAWFADDWEERKLSDVANHRGGTAIEKYFDKDGVYKVISIGSYGLNSQYVDQNIRAISNEITDGRVVNSGELTMVLNDKTANGTIIGRTLLVEKDNEYVINQRTEIISPKENFDSNFAYTILNGPFREKVKRIVQGGTQIYVNYPAVSNLNLELPKIEEQQKIGSFFKQLDDTIALHQRKLDLLKEQKKGYLQKMFAK